MTAQQVQVWAQKQATASLISQEPTLVALVRPGTWSRTASGGQKRSTTLTALQAVQRFLSGVEINDRQQFDFQGLLVTSDHVLVGLANDDIRTGDYFEVDTRRFRVIHVHPNRLYETRAECQFLEHVVVQPPSLMAAPNSVSQPTQSVQPSGSIYNWILDRTAPT